MNADKRCFRVLTPKVRGNGFLLSASIRVNPRFFPRALCVSTRTLSGDVLTRPSALLRGFPCESYRVAPVGKSPIKASTRWQEERG